MAIPPHNLAAFNASLSARAEVLTQQQLDRMIRMLALEALSRIVLKTPVDTGRARGNWQVGINRPPKGEAERSDPGGGGTIQAGQAALANLPPYPIVYITNNLPYIERLEHGHSGQAPQGMVGVTIEELRALFP